MLGTVIMLRTSKVIKEELDKAIIEFNDHCNNCSICQAPITCAEDEMDCVGYTYLQGAVEQLDHELETFDLIFEQELKDRNIVAG